MKKKVSLDLFEESVVPQLQLKHTDAAALQKAIEEKYDIYEEDAEGKQTPVKYTVSGKTATPQEDEADISKVVSETVTKTLAEFNKANPPQRPNIEVKPSFMPDNLKLYRSVQNFTGTQEERKLKAYKFGCFILGGVMGMQKYADKCKEMGIPLQKAQSEGTNTAGGVLVPQELDNFIVDLREQYGVFRGQARVAPMSRDVQEFPRRTGGLTASFKAEAEALAESSKSWDSVTGTAKKLTALAKFSTELAEDAMINIADDLAGEIGYAFAQKEDECGFIGTGASTYGGITGVSPALKALVAATTTSAGGIVIATGNTYAEVVVGDLLNLISVLPQYAEGNAKWYCSRMFHWAVLERLERAAGGVTLSEQRSGAVKTAFGYPVVISQVLHANSGTATSEVFCLFGDLKKSSTFFDRRQTTISISDQVYWANDQVGIKGTERFDIVNHDIGTATAAGPIVGLQGLNS
jgi:HK97 family phage major capsid protein